MIAVSLDEASRIRASQRALIAAEFRTEPDARQIRKAEVHEDIARLIMAIQPVRDQVHRVLAPVIKAMETTENFSREKSGSDAPASGENNISDD